MQPLEGQSLELQDENNSSFALVGAEIQANSIGRGRAIALTVLAFFFTTFTSLLCTGFQGLLPLLLKEKIYEELCSPEEIATETTGPRCTAQSLRLNLMLTIAVAALNLVCFPVGFCVDRFGPKAMGLAGTFILTIGSVGFAFSSQTLDLYIPTYSLIGVGGVCIFMSQLHLFNLFPKYRGFLVMAITAAEDASTGVFYLFQLLSDHTGLSLKRLFLLYTLIPIAHLALVVLQPARPVIALIEESSKSEYYPISKQPLSAQAKSPHFWALAIWNSIGCISTYFYLSNMDRQLAWLFGSEELAIEGTRIFTILFMIFPFAAVPLTGWMLNRFGTWPSLCLVALQFLTYGVASCIPNWGVQYITWIMFVISRSSFIGTAAHYVNLFFGKNFSTLMGFVWTLGGVGNMTNYLWSWIALNLMESDFLLMNIIMTTLAVASTFALAGLVWRWRREGELYTTFDDEGTLDSASSLTLSDFSSASSSNTRKSVELGESVSYLDNNNDSGSETELPEDE